MDLNKLKKMDELFIIGHSKPDIDTIVSSKILSDIFASFGINSNYAILEYNYIPDSYNRGMIEDCMIYNPIIVKNDDIQNNFFFLVDHNDPNQSVGINANIVGCIDHHVDSKLINNAIFTDCCCTALYIYKLFKDKYSFNNEQKKQIFMAFLNDSTFGKSSRYKESDELLAGELGFNEDYNFLFKKYFIPTDTSNGISFIFNNGYKKFIINSYILESSYIESFDEDGKEEYKKKIAEYDGNFFGIWINYSTNKTYVYLKYSISFIEFEYDFIASRATTIINDVINKIMIIGKNKY